MRILLTGSSGFVGQALYSKLDNCSVILVGRSNFHNSDSFHYKDLTDNEDYSDCMNDIQVVLHCAARAHIMEDVAQDPLTEYRRVNTEATLNLARQAAAAGVKRFIFISSIKVNGESTSQAQPFSEVSISPIEDPYGLSKKEAEEALRSIAQESGMEVVIIRPPLVYGPGVKANFLNLLKLADTRLPLPFGAIHNKRSMVYVENLVDFIIQCIEHPSAGNETFLISDGQDLSLATLLTMMRRALDRPVALIPFPASWFCFFGRLLGRSSMIDRLVGDLQVDSSKARKLLDWEPPFTVEQGISATVAAYLRNKNS